MYIGRGSFAVVQLQTYRGLKIAVKRLPNTVVADVRKEAQIPAQLCHPNLPYLFGVVTSKPSYKIIMQYHGLSEQIMSVTLSDVLCDSSKLYDQNTFLLLCAQIAKAVRYLHDEVKILHNDLKCNNVVIYISEVRMWMLLIPFNICDHMVSIPFYIVSCTQNNSMLTKILYSSHGHPHTVINLRVNKLLRNSQHW